jgi:signal peptidase I
MEGNLLPSADMPSRRVPWRAALLGVATTGLGQLYSGRPYRAIVAYLLSGSIAVLCVRASFIPYQPWNIIVSVAGILLVWLLVLGDAIWCAMTAAPDYRLKRYNRWYVYLLLVVLLGAGQEALKPFLKAHFAEGYKNVAGSMLPTIVPGDYFFVNKRAYIDRTPQHGDLVSFRYPSNPSVMFVKRVIAVGGDVIRIKDKKVYLNGQILVEPHVQFQYPTSLPLRDDFPPNPSLLETLPAAWGLNAAWKREMPSFIQADGLHVPPNNVFVMGDNRGNSLDSRYWGFVPQANIIGKAEMIYFSWDAKARRIRWDRVGEVLK